MSSPPYPNGESSPILRLPTSIRLYIFGLSGLGGKLLPYSEAPWTSLYFETRHWEAKIRHSGPHVPKTSLSFEEQRQGWQRLYRASNEQAFNHALYRVSRRVRLEALCALLKYNFVVLSADQKSILDYERWEPERFMILQEVALLSDGNVKGGNIKTIASLLKRRCDFSQLKVHLHEGLYYSTLQDFGHHAEDYKDIDKYNEETSKEYSVFEGVRDFFVYYEAFFEMEIEHEKRVMGDEYDSEKRGKLNPDVRDWEQPWLKSDPPVPMVRGPYS